MQEDLPQTLFAARRQALADSLPDGAVAVLFAAAEAGRNGDVFHPYRPDSYFWYYTGFPEPDAAAIIQKHNGRAHYTLFSKPRDKDSEIWNGRIIGQEEAAGRYGADDALPIEGFKQEIAERLQDTSAIYTILGVHAASDALIMDIVRRIHAIAKRGGAALQGVLDLRRIADEMRMVKTAEEHALMRRAAEISAAGHRAAMLAAGAGVYEYQVQAALEGAFLHEGSHWSFPSIVAGGANACCLHYHANNQPLKDGELLLVDAGAEYAGYAGDITRTFPVNGRFSAEQRLLYDIVLHAQKTAIAAARPGLQHLELHRITSIALMQGLIDAGIVKGGATELVGDVFAKPTEPPAKAKQWYPHGTGHWLGIDVHDVGVYKIAGQSRTYQAGMAITIEPGLYLQPDDETIDPRFRGIGIRIEDDVLITDTGSEVISGSVPKEPDDIEAFMRER